MLRFSAVSVLGISLLLGIGRNETACAQGVDGPPQGRAIHHFLPSLEAGSYRFDVVIAYEQQKIPYLKEVPAYDQFGFPYFRAVVDYHVVNVPFKKIVWCGPDGKPLVVAGPAAVVGGTPAPAATPIPAGDGGPQPAPAAGAVPTPADGAAPQDPAGTAPAIAAMPPAN